MEVQGCSRVYLNMQESAWMFREVYGCAGRCRDIPRGVGIYRDAKEVHGGAGMFRELVTFHKPPGKGGRVAGPV